MGDAIEDQVGEILRANWMPGDWFPCSPEAIAHYAAKARVFREYRPASVIEIGTRCGYSLMAFDAADERNAQFLCIDGYVDEDSAACVRHWERVVAKIGIGADLIVVNSHAIRSLPPADFAHVDGDHTYEGALADLRLVAHVPVILADDCCNPEVERAVEQFCSETGREPIYFHDGLRRAAVIEGTA
jgi:cephalosporin hydroxylase